MQFDIKFHTKNKELKNYIWMEGEPTTNCVYYI